MKASYQDTVMMVLINIMSTRLKRHTQYQVLYKNNHITRVGSNVTLFDGYDQRIHRKDK